MRLHRDDRRDAYCDLFDTPGDVNLFIVKPGQRTCWHRHKKQTDQFRVLRGAVRFGRLSIGNHLPSYDLLSDPGEIYIVYPGVWHGYENAGDDEAYLLMYLDQKYDPADEERMGEARMPWVPV